MQIYLGFSDPGGSTLLNTIPAMDLTQQPNATACFVGAYEMTSGQPVAISSNFNGNPANQLYNVRCTIVRLQ